MNIQSLLYFASAAKHSSFTKAADECLIAQPAMSRQIAGIEDELGVKLFFRYNKKVVLTPAGKAFYSEIQDILQRYSNAVFLTRDTYFGYNEKLSVGFGIYDTPIASMHIKTFAKTYPDVSITLNQYPYDVLIQNLKEGVCDIIFCPDNRARHLNNINIIPVKSAYKSVAVSKNNVIAQKNSVKPDDLEQQVFIIPTEDGAMHSEIFNMFCMKVGLAPKKIMYANTIDSILALVDAEYGLAIIPIFFKETVDYNIKFIPLILNTDNKRTHFVVSLVSNDNNAVKKMLKISEEHYRIDYDPVI